MIEIYKILTFPENYHRLPAMEDDPVGGVNYATATSSAQAVVQAYPISRAEAMRFEYPDEVIDYLHETLGDHQALIEVENGTNNQGMPYIYSIVKSRQTDGGMQYTLIFHGQCGSDVFCVRALFTEIGTLGQREEAVWKYLSERGVVSDQDDSKWARDPYERSRVRPLLMNLSELTNFDEAFPDHPLSLCRALVRFWKGETDDFLF